MGIIISVQQIVVKPAQGHGYVNARYDKLCEGFYHALAVPWAVYQIREPSKAIATHDTKPTS